jgi:hypothetical protein
MSATIAREETCPLCGFVFDAKGQGCMAGCPFASGCHMVCCPRCFYSYPQESWLVGTLRQLLPQPKQEDR